MTPRDRTIEAARRFVADVTAALFIFGSLGVGMVWVLLVTGG